ncbi:MAG TPA: hypothetical protein VIC71_03135, partial [Gammaproteobacteria bacterium]
MTARSQLEAYLREFRERLKALIVARGSAFLGVTALVLTLLAVYFGTRRAFDPEFIIGARTVLVLGLGAVAAWLLIMPLRALRATRGVAEIERRAPAFDGRIETYDGLTRANAATPFVDLLAEDSLKVAAGAPVTTNVRPREISIPAVVALAAAAVLVWFAAFGPDNWRYGVRHLWAGWLVADMLPPQRIAVSPGDGTVRRGGDLAIEAAAEGFDPTTMDVYARFASRTDWQAVPMQRKRGEESFDFTFFAVREGLRYYVSAAGIRSQEYGIEVVDLPEVTQIKLTYEYPAWTKLEPRIEEHGSDIRAVEGTVVTVEVTTDQPLTSAMLVANDAEIPLTTVGNVGTAELRVDADGEYHVATLFNDDRVGLTEDYLISLVPDKKPTVKIARPGRDWRASNIEEVTVAVDANDDFDLDGLELRYSINGGEWTTVTLPADGAQVSAADILYLEDLRQPSAAATGAQDLVDLSRPLTIEDLRELREEFEAEAQAEARAESEGQAADAAPLAPAERALEPGDLISYYAVATDRGQSVQTDLFFVEVQPFERSFTQAGAGAGGGGGGQQEDEISRRQKEILVATWNLIREQKEQDSFLDEQQLEDNARMLAELQRTLADQARTLANRARARQLTGGDPKIKTFVESLEQAAEAMGPAAERLANLTLPEAVPPEQQALQFLLRAEAVFTDIQVSMQRNGGAGGGLAGRDLSELYELEMDLEKNQYETEESVAQNGEQEGQQELDEAIAKLQELARRQEQLAQNAARRNQLTEQERWEQESLRRETEELKRRLEELQQRLANQQNQQGQQGQQGQPGDPSQSAQGQSQSGQSAESAQTAQTIEQLEEALQAMNRASAQGDLDPEQTRRAIEQARRQLQAALEQMTAGRQAAAQEAYSDLAERAAELYAEQREVASDLQRAVEDAASNPPSRNSMRGGLDRGTALDLADRKYQLQQALETLEQDIQRVAQQFRNQTPGASDELNQALANLQQSQAIARLAIAGDYIRQGAAAQIAPIEAVTTSALRDLERDTDEALALATREAVSGEETEPDPNAELVAELQSLRRQLAELTQAEAEANARAAQAGQEGQGQAAGEQPGQQAGGQQGGAQQGGGAFGGNDRFGWGGARGFYDPRRDAIWGPRGLGVWQDPQTLEQLRERLDSAGTDLINLGARLRAEGM